jgi:hypothetical protein
MAVKATRRRAPRRRRRAARRGRIREKETPMMMMFSIKCDQFVKIISRL